ncbi:MAG: hypothetical protein JWM57_4360, partial [Phycisphaerales bacterium]|nr:hypothetical protein [Phycisphaerales bacterium]
LTMYGNEWKYFPGARANGQGINYAIWPTRLRKYMAGTTNVFRCPTQKDDMYDWKQNDTTSGPNFALKSDEGYGYKVGETLLKESRLFSYGYNDWGTHNTMINPQRGLGGDIGSGFGGTSVKEVKFSAIRNATTLIVIGDRTQTPNYNYNISLDPTDDREAPAKIHRGGCNLLHADGHVDWGSPPDLLCYDPANPNIKWITFPSNGVESITGAPALLKKFQAVSPQWNTNNLP